MNIISHLCETRRSVSEMIPLQFTSAPFLVVIKLPKGRRATGARCSPDRRNAPEPCRSAVSLNAKFKCQELMKCAVQVCSKGVLSHPCTKHAAYGSRALSWCFISRSSASQTYDVSLRPQITDVRLSTRPLKLHLDDEQMLHEPRHHREKSRERFRNTRRCSVSFSQHALMPFYLHTRGVRKHLLRCSNA